MKQRVETYVKKCSSCQKNKHATHAKYEEIQYQESSTVSWNEIIMNFIIKLSESEKLVTEVTYDSILMIIDKLIKYSHLISFKESYSADQLEFIVLNRLIWYHDIPEKMTSDRDKLFISNYWKTFVSLLDTKLRLSTAYHPETDDQIERINQVLKQYLRHYVNNVQNNWIILLSMTQLTLSSKHFNTTKAFFFLVTPWQTSPTLDQKQLRLIFILKIWLIVNSFID